MIVILADMHTANAENRARIDFFVEILNRHGTVLLRAGYGGRSSLGIGGPYGAMSCNSSSVDDIRQ
jgi:hypothetical protein